MFKYTTIACDNDTIRLTALWDKEKYCMPSLYYCKHEEEIHIADNPNWILD